MNSRARIATAALDLRDRRFEDALAEAQQGLLEFPGDPALLGMAALALLQLQRREEALPYLFQQVAATPDDKAARFNLASVLIATGQIEKARPIAFAHNGHPGLARIAGFLHQEGGDLDAAIAAYRAGLERAPQDWEGWNNLGNCLAAQGEAPAAIAAFENAINRSPWPSLPQIFLNLSRALGTIQNREARLLNAQEAVRRFPDEPSIQIEHGLALIGAGRNDEACSVLEAAAAKEPVFGEAHLELGLLYEHLNQIDRLDALIDGSPAEPRAERDFLKCLSLRRHNRFAEAKVLADQIPESINPVRTAQLRAEIADRLGDEDEAFRQFSLMNAASAAATLPPAISYRSMIEAQTAAMATPPEFPHRADPEPDPIFVVGFPRSGTTLVDTLLGNLPNLQVFEERPMLAQVDAEFPDLAWSTDAERVALAKQRYLALAAELEGAAAGRRLVDKHPLHMTRLPLIYRLFPKARVIMVERHPADVVLSCYMANFLLNTAMRSFTDLAETARTYDAVFANYTRGRELVPLALHAVRYERMIADLEGEMRPLLAFIDEEWRDDVLDNQASAARRGTVRTASYAQIGQPIYQRAVDRWVRYRRHLEPILPIIAPWAERLGYEM